MYTTAEQLKTWEQKAKELPNGVETPNEYIKLRNGKVEFCRIGGYMIGAIGVEAADKLVQEVQTAYKDGLPGSYLRFNQMIADAINVPVTLVKAISSAFFSTDREEEIAKILEEYNHDQD